ncbi:MAG: siroheme synthase [Deltaproteobacteria bacterium]|nr:MAG: siroheme synthase [Desulfobacterales bacterium]PIE73760.1 MAG: siroheme synthase [Deltaproteobacteria bacterium]
MSLYPVSLNIGHRPCLVVGGGAVALRKIRVLLTAGAEIQIVSPNLLPQLEHLVVEKGLVWRRRPYREGDMDGAFLVFAATNDQKIQQDIAEEAKKKGILLNRADAPDDCDFQVPASFRRGPLLIAVSTGGASPAVAKKLCRQLEGQVGAEFELVAYLMGKIRERVIALSNDSELSGRIFKDLVQRDILALVRDREWSALEDLLSETLPQGEQWEQVVRELRLKMIEGLSSPVK